MKKIFSILLLFFVALSSSLVTNTVNAETVTITFVPNGGTPGKDYPDGGIKEYTSSSYTFNYDKDFVRAPQGKVLNGAYIYVTGTQRDWVNDWHNPGDSVVLTQDLTVEFWWKSANVIYSYDGTIAPSEADFKWADYRPDDMYKKDEAVKLESVPNPIEGEYNGKPGVFTFGWTSEDVALQKSDAGYSFYKNGDSVVNIVGKWTFTENKYDVEYVFDGPSPALDSITPAIPVKASYGEGVSVTLDSNDYYSSEEEYEGKPGLWIWLGWTRALKESGDEIPITESDSGPKITMPSEKVFVHGSWFFLDDDLEFKYTGGTGQTYYLGSDEDLTGFVVKRIGGDDSQTYNLFTELEVYRGTTFIKTLIAGTDYEYSEGSLKHDLKATFLESLEPGTYTIYARFPRVDGIAETTFKVKKKTSPTPPKPVIPKTGIDN